MAFRGLKQNGGRRLKQAYFDSATHALTYGIAALLRQAS